MTDSISLPSTSIRVAQTLGITTSAILSGSIAWTSYGFTPSLLLAPSSTIMTRQWRQLYQTGKATAPITTLFAALNFAYLSYAHYYHHTSSALSSSRTLDKWSSYAIAAVSTLAIVPYTLFIMKPTNQALYDRADEADRLAALKDQPSMEIKAHDDDHDAVEKTKSAKQLLDWWATLNLGRSLFPLVATVVATWTSLS